MKPIDYVIIAVGAAALIGIVVHLIRRKKAGKGGCGCGCAGCPSAGKCSAVAQKNAAEEENEETV